MEGIQRGPGEGGDIIMFLKKVEPPRVRHQVDSDTMRVAQQFTEGLRQSGMPFPPFQGQPGIFTGMVELLLSRKEYEALGNPVPGDEVKLYFAVPEK